MAAADRTREFEEVLAAYLEAKERGEAPNIPVLLREHSQIADELKEFFANERRFASAAGGLGNRVPETRETGSRIGEYEILGEIARGGMGVVYKARHIRLQRIVALKMMLGPDFAGGEGLRRFRTEAEVVASLDHPNIVPIHDVGEQGGATYYAMKFVDGPSLRQHIDDFLGKPEEAVRIVITVARAVHHAHQRGVLHRDLKPGNILLGPLERAKRSGDRKKDKYPVSGIPRQAAFHPKTVTPFVTDFGLAKRFSDDGLASHSTAVVGTAAYMAPEQATGKQALSVAADVYSLGAVLFELLTGRQPFTGQNQMEVLLQAIEKEPPSPLQFQPRLDPDLAQVCLKCLRKNPDDRYGSAEELAEELEHWLEGDPLAVRAPTARERIGRWCRRHPWATAASLVIVLLMTTLIVGSIGVSWHLSDLNHQLLEANKHADDNKRIAEEKAAIETTSRLDADKALAEAEKAKQELQVTLAKEKEARDAVSAALERRRQLLAREYLANALDLTQRGDAASAALWYVAALEQDHGDADREWPHRVRLGSLMRQLPTLSQLWFSTAKPNNVRVSPTGNHLAAVRSDGVIQIWDTRTGKHLRNTEASQVAGGLIEFSRDGNYLAFASAKGTVHVAAVKSSPLTEKIITHSVDVHALVFHPDSTMLATAGADKCVRFWDSATGKPIGKPLKHSQEIRLIAFHPSGKKLVSYAENIKNKNGDLGIWDLATGRDVFLPWPATQGLSNVGFSRDGLRIFAVSPTNKLHLWHTSGQLLASAVGPFPKADYPYWLAPNADRALQIHNTEVKILDLPKSTTAFVLPHESPVLLARYCASGRFIITATANLGLRLWRANNGQQVGHALPHPKLIASAFMSRDDRWLLTCCDDHSYRLWNLESVTKELTPINLGINGSLISLSPDGATALIGQAKRALLRDIVSGKQLGQAIPISGNNPKGVWSPDGRHVAIATPDGARIHDARTGKAISPIVKLDKVGDFSMQLQHASNMTILTMWNSAQVKAWDGTGIVIWQKKLAKQIHMLDCDGTRLALWRNKGALEIQDGRSGKSRPLLKLAIIPEFFRFAPTGRVGIAGLGDGSLRIWDLSTGKPLTPTLTNGSPVRQVAWSPNARLLAALDAAGRIRVWDSATGQPLASSTAPLDSTRRLVFSADGRNLLTWTSDGSWSRIDLSPQLGTPADLMRGLQLTLGQELDEASGNLVPIDSTRLQQLMRDVYGQ